MQENIIISKYGNQFHPMTSVVLFLLCVPIVAMGAYLILVCLVLIFIVTISMKKETKINLGARSFKNGLFSKWESLPENGYLSIFYETDQMLAQARSQQTVIKTKDLRINYIVERTKYHIYTASDMEDALTTANQIAKEWGVKIYNANEKVWIE